MKLLRNRSRLKILVNFYKKRSNYWFNEAQMITKQFESELSSKDWRISCLNSDLRDHDQDAQKIIDLTTELKALQDKYVNLLASSIILEKKLELRDHK